MRISGKLSKNIAQLFRQISRRAEHLFYWNTFLEMYNDDFLQIELKIMEEKIAEIRKLIRGD